MQYAKGTDEKNMMAGQSNGSNVYIYLVILCNLWNLVFYMTKMFSLTPGGELG